MSRPVRALWVLSLVVALPLQSVGACPFSRRVVMAVPVWRSVPVVVTCGEAESWLEASCAAWSLPVAPGSQVHEAWASEGVVAPVIVAQAGYGDGCCCDGEVHHVGRAWSEGAVQHGEIVTGGSEGFPRGVHHESWGEHAMEGPVVVDHSAVDVGGRFVVDDGAVVVQDHSEGWQIEELPHDVLEPVAAEPVTATSAAIVADDLQAPASVLVTPGAADAVSRPAVPQLQPVEDRSVAEPTPAAEPSPAEGVRERNLFEEVGPEDRSWEDSKPVDDLFEPRGELGESTSREDSPHSSEPLRRWIDSTGGHATVGVLVGVTGDSVEIRKANGQFANVAVERLSDYDRDYVAAAAVRLAGRGLRGPGLHDTAATGL